ncbi:MAG: hypothetical protein COB71_11575 [Thiotrichales bacterium]|nr:MAG: hypothetical protein COB71_12570 [Thiotrichales bacterium]PCI11266.1 MAG: hypothetical protein COB71_11575 [Thiotrichales bacterium]
MKWFERLRTRHTLKHHPVPHDLWETLMREAPLFHRLSSVERAHLRELSTIFLHRKTFTGVQGLTVSTEIALAVAAQACLLILKLDLDYYDGWIEIVLYPEAFRVERAHVDAAGLVSHDSRVLSGESWSHGAVILSWADVAAELAVIYAGRNVVLHEFAHKLDMLNGSANGMPALHTGMAWAQWTVAFSDAFEVLQAQLAAHHHPSINPYAATDPAEFFAVVSEYFFTAPEVLLEQYPEVYAQLVLFYRQAPIFRA